MHQRIPKNQGAGGNDYEKPSQHYAEQRKEFTLNVRRDPSILRIMAIKIADVFR